MQIWFLNHSCSRQDQSLTLHTCQERCRSRRRRLQLGASESQGVIWSQQLGVWAFEPKSHHVTSRPWSPGPGFFTLRPATGAVKCEGHSEFRSWIDIPVGNARRDGRGTSRFAARYPRRRARSETWGASGKTCLSEKGLLRKPFWLRRAFPGAPLVFDLARRLGRFTANFVRKAANSSNVGAALWPPQGTAQGAFRFRILIGISLELCH